MLKVGDKVEYLGLCYRITKIDGDTVNLKIFRTTRNPRCRKTFATTSLTQVRVWNPK